METVTPLKYVRTLIGELEKRLAGQRKSDRKQMMTIIRHQSKALKLQAKEYERRLEVLNNDREEAREKEIEFALNKDVLVLKERVDLELVERAAARKAVFLILSVSAFASMALNVYLAFK